MMNIHEPVIQPTPNSCGHTCLAWFLDIDVHKVIDRIGKRKTYPRDLRAYLIDHGYQMQERAEWRLPQRPPKDVDAFLFAQTVKLNRLYGHWFVTVNGMIFDPGDGAVSSTGLGGSWSGRWYRVEPID